MRDHLTNHRLAAVILAVLVTACRTPEISWSPRRFLPSFEIMSPENSRPTLPSEGALSNVAMRTDPETVRAARAARGTERAGDGEDMRPVPYERPDPDEARRILQRVRILLENDRVFEAEQRLAPLVGTGVLEDEVAEFAGEINQRRIENAIRAGQRGFEADLIQEVQQALLLPDSYGKRVRITPDTTNLRLPEGPVEELLNRPFTLDLPDAGLAELLAEFRKIEGFNVIVDQGVQESKRLSISVKGMALKELLGYISRNMGLTFNIGAHTMWITGPLEGAPTGTPLETHIYELKRGFLPVLQPVDPNVYPVDPVDNELNEALTQLLATPPQQPVYHLLEDRNLLLARDTRENLRYLETLLREVDTEPLQVLIEAKFITVRQTDLYKVGLDLQQILFPASGSRVGFNDLQSTAQVTVVTKQGNTTTTRQVTPGQLSEALNYKQLDAVGSLPGQLGILGSNVYVTVLDALRQLTSSRTLSSQRVTVANNRWARTHRGTQRAYFSEYDLQIVNQGDLGQATKLVPVGDPTVLNLGMVLDVRASVGNDGRTVMLALQPYINNLVDWEYFDTVKLPIMDVNSIQTTVAVNSGDTVVLGGTMSSSYTKDMKKVPFFGDLPYIGSLFRNKEDSDTPQHLLIFVTARVIQPTGEYAEYTNEEE
jgi:type IV pilus assembly protein PilQ